MNFNNREISGSTPLKDFPERYNGLISDLNDKITDLENALDKKNTEIENLKKTITSLEANLKASFSTWFDQKMSKFEETYAKSSDVYSKKQINDLFITKTEADNTFVKKTNN